MHGFFVSMVSEDLDLSCRPPFRLEKETQWPASGCTRVLFLLQVRSSLKSSHGFGRLDEVSCGGNALRFYAAVWLRVMRTGLLKTEDKVTGPGVRVQVVKNKLAHAMEKSDLGIQFGRGICFESEVLELACEHGVIWKEGSKYIIEGEVFNNKQEAEQYMAENSGVLERIVSFLRSHLFEREI